MVGGHCIGVDPYYLTHKAEQIDITHKLFLREEKLMTKWLNMPHAALLSIC